MEAEEEGVQSHNEWELSKENIQPLKQGRQMKKLSTILGQQDEETVKAIQEERRHFEEELREYSGEDPLVPWYTYIQWVEQTYPKGGKEGQVHVLIEKCIKKFKDNKDVQNDPRFLEIWLKYAAISSQPLDVYDFMYKSGVCTQQGGLYEAWAYQLERNASYKKADAVFVNGLKAVTDTETKQRLGMKQKQFQARVVRRMKGEDISEAETAEEERSALGQLRGHGRHGTVGSIRVGTAKLGGPGVLATASKQPLKDSNKQKAGGGFAVFSDENSAPGVGGAGSLARLPSGQDRKENEAKAGAWGKTKTGRAANVPLSEVGSHARPTFTVHQDSGVQQPAAPGAGSGSSTALQSRKASEEGVVQCPIALFEPADPTKKAMYCKDRVYQGTTEFSFEELQAGRWRRADKARQEVEDIDRRKQELVDMETKLREQQEAMARQMAEFQAMMTAKQVPSLAVTRPSDSEEPGSSDSSSLLPASRDSSHTAPSLCRKQSMDDTAALVSANPTGARSSVSLSRSQGRTPSPHGSRAPAWTSGPSPTVNTREAMKEMQQLWCNESSVEPAPMARHQAAAPVQFAIFSDENAPTPSTPAPFPIFCDENAPPPSAVAAAPFPIFSDSALPEVVAIKPRQGVLQPRTESLGSEEVADRENCPPPGYSQPGSGRKATGLLTQAEDVEWQPLEEQERLLDEDERRQEEEQEAARRGALPKPAMGGMANQTMALPNEADFEAMAKLSSTPFTGRPFHCEQDENTCAVDIVWRQAMPPPPAPSEMEQEPAAACLSPIVETSREYCQASSSSSSGCDTLAAAKTPGTDKSHWGNTLHTQPSSHFSQHSNKTTDGASLSRTPGHFLGQVSHGVSGYMGDRSNMTKSGIKQDKRELSTPTRPNLSYEKRLKLAEASPAIAEDDEEPTGIFGDMMSEFKQSLGRQPSPVAERSLHMSVMEQAPRDRTEVEASINVTAAPMLNMTGAPGPGLNMTGAPGLNMTAASPSLNMTAAPPSLDMTGAAPALNMTAAAPNTTGQHAPGLDMTAPALDMTAGPAPALQLSLEEQEVNASLQNLSLEEDMDPFSPATHAALLSRLPAPLSSLHGYLSLPGLLPQVRTKSLLTLGEDTFYVSELKGEGGFAKVFAASKQDTEGGMNSTISGIDAVLKVQKPANDWEWMVCREVQDRVRPDLRAAFMSAPRNYSFDNGGIFVTYHQKLGTLLDIVNITKKCGVQKSCIEPMAVYFTIEMLGMVEALHGAEIIHADIKADNFLLQYIPVPNLAASSSEEMFSGQAPSLQLIDFGKSIDLRLLPKGILFNKVCKTDGLLCPEMREGRGWREHIDYFGLAATAYLLLFSTYMDIVQVGDKWEAKGSFKRWWQHDVWKEFFGEFLNLKGSDKESLPDLRAWRLRFQTLFFEKSMGKSLDRLKQDVTKAMTGY